MLHPYVEILKLHIPNGTCGGEELVAPSLVGGLKKEAGPFSETAGSRFLFFRQPEAAVGQFDVLPDPLEGGEVDARSAGYLQVA